MRIVVHDYSGHPFQAQLARALAARGHAVLHHHFAGFQTPKGALVRQPGDPAGLTLEGLDIGEPFQKYSFVKRRRQEIAYGELATEKALAFRPDVVLAANLPLDPLRLLAAGCKAADVRLTVWLQDVYSAAMKKILPARLPVLGNAVAQWYAWVERRALTGADRVVAITADFLPILQGWGIDRTRCAVIENWAPLDEITPLPQANAWSRAHGLAGKDVVLYSGTLGLKHNPDGIAALARSLANRPDAAMVVVSEGVGAERLAAAKAADPAGLANLVLLPFQAYADLPAVLATAAVLLAVIEPEAGIYSVPSKVLSYLCAGRAILLAVPAENLAARTVTAAKAGRVVPPGDTGALVAAALAMLDDADGRAAMAAAARAHAVASFAIEPITDRFIALWQPAPAAAGLRPAA